MATTHSGQHRRNFIKLLGKAARTTSAWNVFNDFVTVSALSLSNSSDSYHIANSKEVWNRREQRYLDTINKYDANTRPLFSQMLAELIEELQEAATSHYTDVLGEIFHELEFHNKWAGQFFTPQVVSDSIALMSTNSDTTAKAIKERGFITINEPCCGAGSLIIGVINAMRRLNLNPSKQVLVVANDIDERCVMMCYIQLSLYGVPAILQQQNTLSLETYGEPFYTPMFVLDGWSWKASRAFGKAEPKVEEEVPIVEEALRIDETGQFCLF